MHGTLPLRRWQVELGATYDLMRTLHYREPANVGARFDLSAGQLRLCSAVPVGSLALPLCTGIEAGALRGQGTSKFLASRSSRMLVAIVRGACRLGLVPPGIQAFDKDPE
jgi:hypothetical protein